VVAAFIIAALCSMDFKSCSEAEDEMSAYSLAGAMLGQFHFKLFKGNWPSMAQHL
jgi:hypothetical protein